MAALLVAGSPLTTSAQTLDVRWEIQGVTGSLLDNVLASTAPTRVETVRSDGELRALVGRAARLSRSALEPMGYYEATSSASIAEEGARRTIVLAIEPGPPVLLAESDIRVEGAGAQDAALAAVPRTYAFERGTVLSHAPYEALKTELANVAADRGYLDARFDSAVILVDRAARTAAVALHFDTGPRFALGEARFQQEVLNPAILAGLVPWSVGDPYEAEQLLSLQTALAEGPYFARVEIVPRRDLADGGVVPIDVRLTPAPRERYSAGAGYASDTGPRATLLAEFRRLNRGGHRAELDARLASVEVRAAARYVIPIRARRGSVLTLSTGYVDLHPSTSDTETWLVGANVAGLMRGWRTELGVTLQRASYDVADQTGITRLLLLGGGASRVRADDRLAPERGSLLRVRARAGVQGALSDVSLREVAVEVRFVVTPVRRIRLRARSEVGVLETSDFDRLPGSIRYFAGGDRSIRGFDYRELGPTDASGTVVGGSRLLVLSGEAEVRLHPELGVAAFFDAGNAMASFSDALERGAGGGLRWLSPFGMVRLDGAFAISREGAPFRIHLSVGPEL